MPDENAANLGATIGGDTVADGAGTPAATQPDQQPKPVKVPKESKADGKSWIAKLMGSSEQAIVSKRAENGQLSLCGAYAKRDIEQSATMELFIQDYLAPSHGPGEYLVQGIRGDGSRFDFPPVRIALPKGASAGPATDPAAAFRAMTDAQIRMQKDAEDRAEAAKKNAKDELQSLVTMAATMSSKKDSGGEMNPMMMMMLMQMMQRQPSESGAGSGAIAAMQEAFRAALDQIKSNAMPPMLPPMPPPDPGPDLAEMVTALAAAMKPQESAIEKMLIALVPALPAMLTPKEEKGFKMQDLLSALPLLIPLVKSMTGADAILDLKNEIREMRDRKSDGIAGLVDQVRLVRQMADEIAPAAPAGQSFFDFMKDFVTSLPDTANAIGDLVQKINAVEDKPRKRLKAKEKDEDDDDEEVLTYPDGFEKFTKEIGASKTSGEYIGNTLKAIQFLSKHKEWAQHLGGVFQQAKAGDKEDVLDFMGGFLEGLRDSGLLKKDTCAAALEAFKNNIDSVIAWAQGFGKKKNDAGKADGKADGKAEPKPTPVPEPQPEATS